MQCINPWGLWLLARIWVHGFYNTGMPKIRQQPLTGLGFSDTDWIEISHLQLELAKARSWSGPESVR
jgi:hypothetical protein